MESAKERGVERKRERSFPLISIEQFAASHFALELFSICRCICLNYLCNLCNHLPTPPGLFPSSSHLSSCLDLCAFMQKLCQMCASFAINYENSAVSVCVHEAYTQHDVSLSPPPPPLIICVLCVATTCNHCTRLRLHTVHIAHIVDKP